MLITERAEGDIKALLDLARRERDAAQKDRYLAAAHAAGGMETLEIQRCLARSRGFVQRWAFAYRDGGIEALRAKPRGGSIAKITGTAAETLKARLDAGPLEADGVCTLRGKDVQRIAKDELNTKVSLTSVYRTLHRLGYSCLAPRPRHEKRDLPAQERFKKESAPLLFARSSRERGPAASGCESSLWMRPGSVSRGPRRGCGPRPARVRRR